MAKAKTPKAAVVSIRSRAVKAANDKKSLREIFPELDPVNPEAENLLSEIIDDCRSYNELLLRVAAVKLERRLSFGVMIQLLFWAQVERIKDEEETWKESLK